MLQSLLTGSQFGPEIQILKGGRENPMNSGVARTFCPPTAHSFIFTHLIVYEDLWEASHFVWIFVICGRLSAKYMCGSQ